MPYITMERTTIQISKKTRKMLDELKSYPEESMDTLILRLAERNIDSEPLSKEEVESIKKGLEDYEKGKFYTMAQIKKKYGI